MIREREDAERSLAALEALWWRKRGDRAMPTRRDFPFEECLPWQGHLRVIAVGRDPLRLTVTLDGLEIVATAGIDLTGRDLLVAYGAEPLRFLLAGYHKIMADPMPTREVLHPNGAIVNFGEIIRLLLPCGQGDRVDHIIYCEYAFDVYHWGRTVFADERWLDLSTDGE